MGALVSGALGLGPQQVGVEGLLAMGADVRFELDGHVSKVAAPPLLSGVRERI